MSGLSGRIELVSFQCLRIKSSFSAERSFSRLASKTDRIRPEGVPARTAYYAAQLRAYAGAMARITGQPVCRRVLYFLHCGQVSDVPGPDA